MVCPTDSQEVRAVLAGIRRRFQKPVSKKKALSVEDFAKILLSVTGGGDFKAVMFCDLGLAAQVPVMLCTFSRCRKNLLILLWEAV